MTTASAPDAPAAPVAHAASSGRWIDEWEPEDEALGIWVVRWGWDDIWKPAAARATAARLHTALRHAA